MSAPDRLLLGCGILRREVRLLCEKHGWPLERRWLSPDLHGKPLQLGRSLSLALAANAGREVIVMYGCCHPQMDALVARPGVRRLDEQNCLTMLLGADEFAREVQAGAYFLLEDWMRDWSQALRASFGTCDMGLVGEIFRADRQYLLALRTPCSGDYTAAAEAAAELVGLPLRWRDCGLEHLEDALRAALAAPPKACAAS
ncbi:MAG: DUF1638 domain-containing protein [Candidatus Eisenbacteria bacterium]